MSFITQGKTNWKFLTIVAILAVIVGGGIMRFNSSQKFSYQSPDIKALKETADWQEYKNEEYGFKMKYPKEWVIKTTNSSVLFTDSTKTDVMYPNGLMVFNINISNTELNSIDKYFEQKFKNRTVPEYSEIVLGNNVAFKFTDSISEGGCDETVVFLKNSKVYELYRTGSTCEYSDKLFSQIISTFGFIEADETVDWQTYKNEEYGFEIKYPENFFGKTPEIINAKCNPECTLVNAVGTAPQGNQKIQKLMIENIPVCVEQDLDSGMGSVQENDYLTVSNGENCYAIYLSRVYSSCSVYYGLPERQDEYKNCMDSKANQGLIFDKILSTLKFIETISLWPDINSFDLENKTFEGKILFQNQRVKVLATDSTKIYQTVADAKNIPGWEDTYYNFAEFRSLIKNWSGPEWRFNVNGTIDKEGVVTAEEIFYYIQ